MKAINLTLKLSLIAVLALFSSCSDDDDISSGGSEYTGDNPFVSVLAYAPGTGYDYSYYPIRFESLMGDQTLSAEGIGNITQVGYYEYSKIDDVIYSMGGLDYTDVSAINDVSGKLIETPFNLNFTNSVADLKLANDNNLVAIEMGKSSDIVVLHNIDPDTYDIISSDTTSCYDISKNMDAHKGEESYLPHYTGMEQSGDYLYVSYYILGPSSSSPYIDEAEIAIFKYPSLEYETTIYDTRTGPIGGWNTNSGLIKDSDGNIYCLSHTNPANGYDSPNSTAGYLRINAGETKFDENYFFDLTQIGDGYTTANSFFIDDNKLFAEMNVAKREDQVKWSDAPLKCAIIDLDAGTVSYFNDVPEHEGTGRNISSSAINYNGYIYLPISNSDGIYYYKLNPDDMSSERGAKVEANFVAGTFRF